MNAEYFDTYRWDWRLFGLDIFVEVDRDSRIGRFLERRGF